ncbi:MAG TPA: NINE protein [Candidatus Acidoferrum sp.]|nr:NINE protein [Candidatus Acidoferrum sp.]
MNPVCPYCRTEVGSSAEERLDCPGCGTPHHPECFAENGGCTVFGCSKAPQDEPKISVSGTELNRAPAPVATTSFPPTPVARRHSGGFSILQLSGPSQPLEVQNPPASGAMPPPPPPPASGTGAPPPPAPSPRGVYAPLRPQDVIRGTGTTKSRQVYVLLGIFLGIFGVHNFYAGYIQRAVSQLCLTVLTCFYGAVVSWIWAIVEVCTISKDCDGVEFI